MSKDNEFDLELNKIPFYLSVHATINYSESENKVRLSVNNIFPSIKFIRESNQLIGKSQNIADISVFRQIIANQKILDAARNYVLSNIEVLESSNDIICPIFIHINKQIAFYGKINFCSANESPLEPITIKMELNSDHVEEFIDIIFPKYEWLAN